MPTLNFPARLCITLLFLFVLAGAAMSGTNAQTVAPLPYRALLPDGARLILRPEAGAGRVSISLFVRMEPEAASTLKATGELVARALFYGNRDRTANGVITLATQTGGSYDVLHTPDYVAVTVVAPSSQLPEAAHLLSDCLKNADFAPAALAHARTEILEERARRHDDGLMRGYDAVCETLRPSAPDEDALRRVTQAQAQDYFRRHYGPARTVIAVAGSFDAARATALFAAFLADYTRPTSLVGAAQADPMRETAANAKPAATQYRVLAAPSTSAYALLATSAPAVTHPDYPAFVVLQNVLGGGHACRLFQQAREERGVGYKVGALYQADRAAPLIAYLQWDAAQKRNGIANGLANQTQTDAGDIQLFLNAQLDGLLQNPPSEEELTRARNFAIGVEARRHERVRDRSFLLGWYEAMGLGYVFDADLPRRLAAVTPDDVLRVAKTYLATRAGVVVLPSR